MLDKFNIRVYGLLVKDNKILLSQERIDQRQMLKFPGGGLKFGEGLKDALLREFTEELQLSIAKMEQLYTSDDFIQSSFRSNEQVIAIYYRVWTNESLTHFRSTQKTAYGKRNFLEFSWRELKHDLAEELSFDTDKQALNKLLYSLNKVDGPSP